MEVPLPKPISAGLLLYRQRSGPEVLLVHPGGPFWARKDAGAWSIPKGICEPGEDPLAAAKREFAEELGIAPPAAEVVDLGAFPQRSGKVIRAWAAAGDLDLGGMASNHFEMEWPPRSGRRQSFPEVDRAAWLPPEAALVAIIAGQAPILETLFARLSERGAAG